MLINERIISLRFKVDRKILTVIGSRAPEVGKNDETAETFCIYKCIYTYAL